MYKIIVHIEGGLVQAVYSNLNEEIEVEVMDTDVDMFDEGYDDQSVINNRLMEESNYMKCIY